MDPLRLQWNAINGKDGSFLWYINTPSRQARLEREASYAREREECSGSRVVWQRNLAGFSFLSVSLYLYRSLSLWDGCVDALPTLPPLSYNLLALLLVRERKKDEIKDGNSE